MAAEDDPAKFVHLFEFANQSAQQAHGTSKAVRKSETARWRSAQNTQICVPQYATARLKQPASGGYRAQRERLLVTVCNPTPVSG